MASGGVGGIGGSSGNIEMPDHRKRNTFTSYVAPLPDLSNEWIGSSDMRDVQMAKPRLLPHEQFITFAPAYMYSAIAPMDIEGKQPSNNKNAVFGLLSVTNFKLAFVPLHRPSQTPLTQLDTSSTEQLIDACQENLLLQRNEVTLNSIDHVYTIAEAGRAVSALNVVNVVSSKRKKLDSQLKTVSGRIAALHIVCKNFRLLKFAFQLQDSKSGGARDYGKHIATALAIFAYQSNHDLSFANRYKEPYISTLPKSSVIMYATKNDWARELIRCGATEWQVISADAVRQLRNVQPSANNKYTLPPHFVIPKSCTVERFLDLSLAFCDSRCAFWVYSYGGASLVRMAELKPALQQDSKLENITLELVRKCDERRQLKLLQLTDRLPSVHDVQRAYQKFRRLCTPETPEQFLLQESKFLTLLEKTNWLLYVSYCLRYSSEAAETLRQSITCVLQESNGRDLCCVISSLTQIMLDPLYRTIDGFQSLVQKEWVALEHPFQRRLGYVRNNNNGESNTDKEESPVFLLFLDCVWQLLQQFPEEFEFSQTYLTTLWDSCFLPIFDTFQFNTEAERACAVIERGLVLRPVWDWGEQFAERDKAFFTNPFYQRQRFDAAQQQHIRRSIAVPSSQLLLHQQSALTSTVPSARNQLTATAQRCTINPQLFVTQSTIPKDRFLEPQHRISELSIWEQCYYRWLPVLEIKGGGYPQIELQQRILLSNIARMQRAIELQDFDDLPDVYYEITGETRPNNDVEDIKTTITKTNQNIITKANVNVNEKKAPAPLQLLEDPVEYVDGVERRRKPPPPPTQYQSSNTNGYVAEASTTANSLPTISSFFPFGSSSSEAPQQLLDILTDSNDLLLLESASIMDKLSLV